VTLWFHDEKCWMTLLYTWTSWLWGEGEGHGRTWQLLGKGNPFTHSTHLCVCVCVYGVGIKFRAWCVLRMCSVLELHPQSVQYIFH
jgi:hypothetical protein